MDLYDELWDDTKNQSFESENELDYEQELETIKQEIELKLQQQEHYNSRLIKLDVFALAETYMNKDELAYKRAKLIKPLDGFEDFLVHGEANAVIYDTNNGLTTKYSASEFADILKNDPRYKGGNIRLLACSSGFEKEGFAQQLADILGVDVLAPTETLWIDENGELFVTNNVTLADMWEQDKSFSSTGKWKLFHPRKEKK